MEIILVIIGVLAVQAALVGAGYVGYRIGMKRRPVPPDVNEAERIEREKLRKGYQEIMAYSVGTATKRRSAG